MFYHKQPYTLPASLALLSGFYGLSLRGMLLATFLQKPLLKVAEQQFSVGLRALFLCLHWGTQDMEVTSGKKRSTQTVLSFIKSSPAPLLDIRYVAKVAFFR